MTDFNRLVKEIVKAKPGSQSIAAPPSRRRRLAMDDTHGKLAASELSVGHKEVANHRNCADSANATTSIPKTKYALSHSQPIEMAPSTSETIFETPSQVAETTVALKTGAQASRRRSIPIAANERADATSMLPQGDGHESIENHRRNAIFTIRRLWQKRQRWHRAEKALILQAKAFCRSILMGDKEAASALFDQAAKGDGVDMDVAANLAPFLSSIESFRRCRAETERDLIKRIKRLPIRDYVKSIRGFGDLNLAALVGECGDIGSYKSVAALWKRMGLAVFDGKRQRKVKDAEEAVVQGYSPQRRAVAFLLGDCLIRQSSKNPYYQVYLDRKASEMAREDEGKPDSLIHAHRRAARYMVKRVLRDLYGAWKKLDAQSSASNHLSIGIEEGAASKLLNTSGSVPRPQSIQQELPL